MKFKLESSDHKKFSHDLATNPIMKFLKHREELRFSVGDVLIKQTTRWVPHGAEREWANETVSSVSNAPKKYVYVYENEFGIGYIRQLKADGSGFTTYWCCLANIDPDTTRFIVDPEYAEHLLLSENGDDYNYNAQFLQDKAKRTEILKHNKALLEDVSSPANTNDVLRKLVPGQTFWYGGDVYTASGSEWTVISVKVKPLSALTQWERQSLDSTATDWVEVTCSYNDKRGNANTTYTRVMGVDRFVRRCLMIRPPRSFKDEV
jgi:hypothetical protein